MERISWLEPDTTERLRAILGEWSRDFAAHFTPDFRPPPQPLGMPEGRWSDERWARATEHVARSERVAQATRADGLQGAVERFGESPHAVEVATLVALALEQDIVHIELVLATLGCAVDELLLYGPILQLLGRISPDDSPVVERAVTVYRAFCAALVRIDSSEAMWADRVRAARDGLAGFYVHCGRLDEAHTLFSERHDEDSDGILVALSASRSFLAARHNGRAAVWLELGAERARQQGRTAMADKLRGKAERIRARG
jgi:hypothetical protein